MKVAIIDADEICYKVGFGTQHTYYNVYDENKIFVARFVDSKDCKQWVNGEEGFSIEKEIVSLPAGVAIKVLKSTIKDIILSVGATEYILCLSSPINFRNEIATLQDYKGNRKVDSKPIHYQLIKDYILENYTYNISEGYEADDLLAIFYNDINPNHEEKAVIITQDKDLLQVPAYFLNLGTEKHLEYGDKGKVFYIDQATGDYNFYSQLISGDSTDNIPGIYQITEQKNSKKFLERLDYIKSRSFERDRDEIRAGMYNHVYNLYLEALGAKIKCREQSTDLDCILWEIGNLLYMRRSFDDTGWEIPL